MSSRSCVNAKRKYLALPDQAEGERYLLLLGTGKKKEEILWWQRSRVNYLQHGDRNTGWFHQRANGRRSTNIIEGLQGADGEIHSDPEELEIILTNYFSQLFTPSTTSFTDEVIGKVPTTVSGDMNDKLCRLYIVAEVEKALQQIHPSKAPGPDSLNPFFYQKYWYIVGGDVTKAVLGVLNGSALPPVLNHTHVVLIPKKRHPIEVADSLQESAQLETEAFRSLTGENSVSKLF